MQLAIEIPDELGQEVLQHANVQQFVKRALEKELSVEKKLTKPSKNYFR